MEAALFVIAFGIVYFLTFGLHDVVRTYMDHKVKIANAERDAKKYELEIARITSVE